MEAKEDTNTTRTDTRIPDEFVGHFRLLRSWTRKLEVARTRTQALQKMIQHKTTPRTFMKIIQPAIPAPKTSFILKWHEAHRKYATELTLLLADFWQEFEKEANFETSRLEEDLKKGCTKEVVEHIKTTITMQLKRNIQENQRKRRRIEDSTSLQPH